MTNKLQEQYVEFVRKIARMRTEDMLPANEVQDDEARLTLEQLIDEADRLDLLRISQL